VEITVSHAMQLRVVACELDGSAIRGGEVGQALRWDRKGEGANVVQATRELPGCSVNVGKSKTHHPDRLLLPRRKQ
jgi:hypothetical protein